MTDEQLARDIERTRAEQHGAAETIGPNGKPRYMVDSGLNLWAIVAIDRRDESYGRYFRYRSICARVTAVREVGNAIAAIIARVLEPLIGVERNIQFVCMRARTESCQRCERNERRISDSVPPF
jgi:hypothetical protein